MGTIASVFVFELKLLRNDDNRIQISPCVIPDDARDPLWWFINAFLRNDRTYRTTLHVHQYVEYSLDPPPAILLIIQRPYQPKRAYICERGGTEKRLPSSLSTYMAHDILDISRLPPCELLYCLRRFVDSFCVICHTTMANVWLSCGHVVMCVTCARLTLFCPRCHTPIPDAGCFYLPPNVIPPTPHMSTYPRAFVTGGNLVQREGWILSKANLNEIQQRSQTQKIRDLWLL